MRILFLLTVAGLLLCGGALAGSRDLMGVWQVVDKITALRTIDGAEPPLLPAAKAVYEARRKARRAGDMKFDPTTQCLPHGVPRLLYEPMPFEILPQPKLVVFMHQWNRLARVVALEKSHSEPLGPTFLGQSVGRWEDDTLVVDTNGFNDSTLLDAEGMPHSDELHVIERFTLSRNGSRLDALITIEDPQTFSRPWQTRVSFQRLRDGRIEEDVCVERLGLEQYQ